MTNIHKTTAVLSQEVAEVGVGVAIVAHGRAPLRVFLGLGAAACTPRADVEVQAGFEDRGA